MDRGGTITWYLTANDADFNSTVRRVRTEARRTATDVDKDFKRGLGGAKISFDDFHKTMGRSATQFRNFQIAIRGFEMTAMIIGVAGAVGAVIQLAGAVSSLLGLLYTAPAAIGAFAGAFATLKIATGGIGKAFQGLTKTTGATAAASGLARKQSDLMRNAMRQDEALTRRLTDLKEDYNDVLRELAEERMEVLNEQIMKGVVGWTNIADAAEDYLNISKSLTDLTEDITEAQDALNTAMITYGPASQEAINASRDLFAAQGKLAGANADLDTQYGSIKDSVKDLATNLESLRKANRNEMVSSSMNLKALRQDKIARGENVDEISSMIEVLDDLISIKDTKLGLNPDFTGAQKALDDVKKEFPNIAVAAVQASTETENSLNKSLQSITESMEDVRRERQQLQEDLSRNMSEAMEDASAPAGGGEDPFAGLSRNARSFVIALKDVYDAFQPVKFAIQDKFFAGLDTEIRNLANVGLPILDIGLGYIATAMNGMAKEASRVMQQPFFTGALMTSMSNTAQVTEILTKAVEPLARAFTDLMNIGNPYLIMLADWVVTQSNLAAAFTGSEEGQNKINTAIKNGLDALKQLGDLLGSVVGLLSDLFAIANNGDGDTMVETLTKIVDGVREWLKVGENQDKMKALFEASSIILLEVANVVGFLAGVVLNVVKAFNDLDGPTKNIVAQMLAWSLVLTPIITYISALLASGILMKGVFTEVFQAGKVGVGVFGKMKQGLFDLQSGFNDSRAAGSTFTGVMGTIGGKLATLRDGLVKAGTAVLDVGKKWATTAAQTLLSIGQMIARQAILVATTIAGAVASAAAWVVANAAMLGVWGLAIAAIVGAVVLIVANWDTIVEFFKGVWDSITGFIAGTVDWVKNNWPLLLAILTGPIGIAVLLITQHWDTIKNAFSSAWEFIKNVWSAVGGFFQGVWNGIVNAFGNVGNWFRNMFQQAWNGVTQIWNNVGNFFGGVWNNIVNAFNGAWNLGSDIVRGLWNGISNMTSWVVSKIQGFGQSVLGGIKSFFGIKSPSRIMRDQVGKMLGLGVADGITASTGEAVGAAKSAAEQITDAFAMNTLGASFAVAADSTITSQFAPSMLDDTAGGSLSGGSGVVINQTNEIYSDVDMEQVNRNLTWEMSKV